MPSLTGISLKFRAFTNRLSVNYFYKLLIIEFTLTLILMEKKVNQTIVKQCAILNMNLMGISICLFAQSCKNMSLEI